jgi:hypothetical protein
VRSPGTCCTSPRCSAPILGRGAEALHDDLGRAIGLALGPVLVQGLGREIVETVVDLAHSLGLRAVGEGVETEAELAVLAACGCDEGQGFLLGRPMPAEALRVLSPACSTT